MTIIHSKYDARSQKWHNIVKKYMEYVYCYAMYVAKLYNRSHSCVCELKLFRYIYPKKINSIYFYYFVRSYMIIKKHSLFIYFLQSNSMHRLILMHNYRRRMYGFHSIIRQFCCINLNAAVRLHNTAHSNLFAKRSR